MRRGGTLLRALGLAALALPLLLTLARVDFAGDAHAQSISSGDNRSLAGPGALAPGANAGFVGTGGGSGAGGGGGGVAIVNFVAATFDGTPSSDGATAPSAGTPWISANVGSAQWWIDSNYNGSQWLLLANNLLGPTGYSVSKSSNGASWTFLSAVLPSPVNQWTAIGSNASTYCIAGSSSDNLSAVAAVASNTAASWVQSTAATFDAGGASSCCAIAWDGTKYAILATSNDTTSRVSTSPDCSTWTARTISTTGGVWASLVWNNSIYCGVGQGNKTVTSTNGTTWTGHTGTPNITHVAWNGTIFCGVDGNDGTDTSYSSTDCVTWTSHALLAEGGFWGAIAASGSTFVALPGSDDNHAAISTDCSTWSTAVLPSVHQWSTVAGAH